MIRQSTIDKLHDMRLSAMSDAFECQCKDPDTYQGLSFEDRFGMLVDKEWDKRKSTKLQKLIRSAEFRYPNACMEDIEYHPDRNLDKGQMLEFSTCRYISDDHHIILKGASGNGKTYIACYTDTLVVPLRWSAALQYQSALEQRLNTHGSLFLIHC